MGRVARQAAGGALGIAAGLAAWALLVEPRRLRVRRRALALPAWPERLAGLRVGVVGDLHAGAPGVGPAKLRRVAAALERANPDLVLLLGDFVVKDMPGGDPLDAAAATAPFADLSAPLGVYAVLGNQDWEIDGRGVARGLRGAGVRVLENEAVRVGHHGRTLWIVGIADIARRRPDLTAALGAVTDDGPILLLSHSPDVFPWVPPRVALTLAGHTHGGQLNVPVLRGLLNPSWFGSRFNLGHVVEDGRHLFVHPGVGTSRVGARLGATPEVTILELLSSGARRG